MFTLIYIRLFMVIMIFFINFYLFLKLNLALKYNYNKYINVIYTSDTYLMYWYCFNFFLLKKLICMSFMYVTTETSRLGCTIVHVDTITTC